MRGALPPMVAFNDVGDLVSRIALQKQTLDQTLISIGVSDFGVDGNGNSWRKHEVAPE